MQETITIQEKEKITTLRITDRTKKILESLAVGKETHEEIILRIIKLAQGMSSEGGTQIIEQKNIIGTKYHRLHKTLSIKIANKLYETLCTYNDLGSIDMLRKSKEMREYLFGKGNSPEWELHLEIANIKEKGKWVNPQDFKSKNKKEYFLLYFAALKQILEETFDIKAYEILTDEDYSSLEKWQKVYKRFELSQESLDTDIVKMLR